MCTITTFSPSAILLLFTCPCIHPLDCQHPLINAHSLMRSLIWLFAHAFICSFHPYCVIHCLCSHGLAAWPVNWALQLGPSVSCVAFQLGLSIGCMALQLGPSIGCMALQVHQGRPHRAGLLHPDCQCHPAGAVGPAQSLHLPYLPYHGQAGTLSHASTAPSADMFMAMYMLIVQLLSTMAAVVLIKSMSVPLPALAVTPAVADVSTGPNNHIKAMIPCMPAHFLISSICCCNSVMPRAIAIMYACVIWIHCIQTCVCRMYGYIKARIALRTQKLSGLPVLSCVCRYAHTQPMLDLLLAPESFLLSERYASAVKTVGLAIFFMPVLPLGCVIALVGLSSSIMPFWSLHPAHTHRLA